MGHQVTFGNAGSAEWGRWGREKHFLNVNMRYDYNGLLD